MQPFRDDKVTIYLNGEIYNYIELIIEHQNEFIPKTTCDVEILPFLYKKYGIAFLSRINGMFSMVIIDERTSQKYLIRDRYGKKPLFYHKASKEIVFASEIKALERLIECRANHTSLAINLYAWLLVDPITLFEGIFSIKPGSYIHINQEMEIKEQRWYTPTFVQTDSQSLISRIDQTFSDAINKRLRSDVPVGVFLSGGLDSVLIAHYALKSNNDIFAITANIVGKESFENNSTDVAIPPRFSRERGMINSAVVVDFDYWNANILGIANNFEEICVDSGNLVFYALAQRAAAEGIKVIYTGVGGDESFGGYPWQKTFNRIPGILQCKQSRFTSWGEDLIYFLSNQMPHGRVSRRLKMTGDLYFNPYMSHASSVGGAFFDVMRDVERKVVCDLTSLANDYFSHINTFGIGDWMNQINYANIYTATKNQNTKADMGCMASSVENRSPFLDYRLVELMLGVPHFEKTKNGPKGLLRELAKSILPDYVVTAPKSGPTMPLHIWFSDCDIRCLIIGFIQRNKEIIGDIISSDLVDHIVKNKQFFEGKSGSVRLFALTSYILWAHIHIAKKALNSDIMFTDYARA